MFYYGRYFYFKKKQGDFIKDTLTENTNLTPDRAILAALVVPRGYKHNQSGREVAMSANETEADISLAELSSLADTAGIETAAYVKQSKAVPDIKSYFGKGKIEEIKALAESDPGITMLIVDDELSPSQIRTIEDSLGGKTEVIDRTMLILEIFAMRAESSEGKLQVELAMLRYTMPRLTGKGKEMSRLAGNSSGGMGARRGGGETKLELDRRNIKSRISSLEEEIKELAASREVKRARRQKNGVPSVAVAGYTNAGKSTLLNTLTGSDILAENKLFATLDPRTRKRELPGGREAVFTDTVGFINKLPHQLVRAFKSTLEEVKYSDIILVVCDISDAEYESKLATVKTILAELGCAEKPTLTAFNKCDLADGGQIARLKEKYSRERAVFISAETGEGMEELLRAIEAEIEGQKRRVELVFPYTDRIPLDYLHENAKILSIEYRTDSLAYTVSADNKTIGKYRKYVLGINN